jgi:hypothetical protein
VFPPGFLRTGHGMGADKVAARAERDLAEAADFSLHAAHVGDDRARGEVRCDLLGEQDNLIDGRGDHDERRVLHGGLGRVGDFVAPRLFAQFQPRFRPARPQDDPLGYATGSSRARHRAAEQAGGEDGELGEGGHDGPNTQNPRTVSSPSTTRQWLSLFGDSSKRDPFTSDDFFATILRRAEFALRFPAGPFFSRT